MRSTERFLGVLIEHYAGNFPVWLSPVQVMVMPITDSQNEYAAQIGKQLKAAHLRAELDLRSERVNGKVRDAQLRKIPYMLVVGNKEAASDTVSLRLRTNETVGRISLAEFIAVASLLDRERKPDLWM